MFADERLMYSGELCNGIPWGIGTMTWTYHATYHGSWIDGKKSGFGKYTLEQNFGAKTDLENAKSLSSHDNSLGSKLLTTENFQNSQEKNDNQDSPDNEHSVENKDSFEYTNSFYNSTQNDNGTFKDIHNLTFTESLQGNQQSNSEKISILLVLLNPESMKNYQYTIDDKMGSNIYNSRQDFRHDETDSYSSEESQGVENLQQAQTVDDQLNSMILSKSLVPDEDDIHVDIHDNQDVYQGTWDNDQVSRKYFKSKYRFNTNCPKIFCAQNINYSSPWEQRK